MTLNQLYNRAARQGIDVDYFPMREIVSVSLPAGYVAIDVDKIKNTQHEKYVLAHEIGHIEVGAFYNIHSPADIRGRHEARADRRAIEMLIPWDALLEASQCGICEKWELAEYFDVSESLIIKAVEYYCARGFLN